MEPVLGGIALTPQGLKRKAETPLASPPEPGQVLQDEPPGKIVAKGRVSSIEQWFSTRGRSGERRDRKGGADCFEDKKKTQTGGHLGTVVECVSRSSLNVY